MLEQKEKAIPENSFFAALDELEKLAKGLIPSGDGENEDLEKSQTDGGIEDLDKGCGGDLEKSGDGDEDEDEDGNDDEGVEKSQSAEAGSEDSPFTEDLINDNEDIQKAVEVSDFLAALVDKVGEAIDGIRQAQTERLDAIEKSLFKATEANQNIALSIVDTLKKSFQSVADRTDRQTEDLRKSVEALNNELAKQPLRTPKSKTTVLQKSFEGGEGEKKEMSKDQILKSLTSMFERGDPAVTSMDIVRFESGGSLSPHLIKKLTSE